MATILTGIKPTGDVHLGRYLGAMRPAIQQANDNNDESFLFVADYHALTTIRDPKQLNDLVYGVAAAWIACGLDPKKITLFRQSDVPEVMELAWIIACHTPKGLMNRAHAYKSMVAHNIEKGKKDLDDGVEAGVYYYPILMAADILMFDTDIVPVGEDQVQHIEICRDLAQKINGLYPGDNGQDTLKLPKSSVDKNVKTIPGLDGRKMSASYGNTIPLFVDEKKLRKLVMKIITDSTPPEDPKDPKDSVLFDLYKEFATEDEIEQLRQSYAKGIGWGYVKQELFEVMNRELLEKRNCYNNLMANKDELDDVLCLGAEKARERAQKVLKRVRRAVGIERI